MRMVSVAATAALIVFACIASALAREPPPEGWAGNLAAMSYFCDAADDIAAIVAAGPEDPDARVARFKAFEAEPGAGPAPRCRMALVLNAVAGSRRDLGVVAVDETRKSRAWALEVTAGATHGWMLWLEEPLFTAPLRPRPPETREI